MIQNFKLGELFEIQLGKTPARGNKKMWDQNKMSNNIWLSIKDLNQADSNGYVSDSDEYISDDGAKLVKLIPKDTLLLSFKLTLGRTAITKIPLRTNEAIAALLPKTDQCNIRYLKYYFEYFDFIKFASNDFKVKGLTLNKKKLADIPIPVPSLQEQEKIVEKLDKVFDKIQHIENKHATEVNFINNFKKSFIKNKFDNNTYEFQKLEDIFEITSSKRVFKSEWTSSGIPFLRARELVKLANNLEFKDPIFISESHYEKIKNKYGVPKNGDILITGVGTLGITYLVDDEEKFYFKDGNIIWLKNLNKVNSEFIKLYIDSPDIQTKINNKIGATVKTFTISDANKLEVPVPPKKIQDKLINEIKNFNILLDNFKELNSMKIKKLSLLKKSILNKEFSYE